ncbi:MAG TPA: M20/M25/M40 family metallo-hydrolase [Candidatus Limnocylindria bacterium]|nr:M20/M25/M40 family metallo-hydrolase [Candidatus Limnocylindria bacterium]
MTAVEIDWDRATDEVVDHLRALIRIPSVNPPDEGSSLAAGRDPLGGETAAARYCAEVLDSAGIAAEVLEAAPGRGSCFARLGATVPDPDPPLVLLSHTDVVPVEADAWTRDPFAGDLVDGVVWGRGAVDMKAMVAMELGVMLGLARGGSERRRDVIFASLADEEAGGTFGAQFWVDRRPDLFSSRDGRPAAAALNEVGGYSVTVGKRRVYTIQVAEKGIIWTRATVSGTPGHGSMPHADNPAVKLSEALARVAGRPQPPRLIGVVRAFLTALGLEPVIEAAERGDGPATDAAIGACMADPVLRRSINAMLRDTATPTVIRVGQKMNVIAGRGHAEIDVRTLPGTDQPAFLNELRVIAGGEVTLEPVLAAPAVEWPADAAIVRLMEEALRRADPAGIPAPMMITPGTDAKALHRLGIPTYGFSPLRLEPETPFLALFHGHDERVPVSALRFGLPVLWEVVSRFVG